MAGGGRQRRRPSSAATGRFRRVILKGDSEHDLPMPQLMRVVDARAKARYTRDSADDDYIQAAFRVGPLTNWAV